MLFDGIKVGVFSTAKFDSMPELILARLLERETDYIKTWLRPSPNEFNITYNNGKRYEPDFVVETKSNVFLIEVNNIIIPTTINKINIKCAIFIKNSSYIFLKEL